MREVISIGDFDKEMFKLHGINLMFGKVNHVDYATSMMHFPTLRQLAEMIEKDK